MNLSDYIKFIKVDQNLWSILMNLSDRKHQFHKYGSKFMVYVYELVCLKHQVHKNGSKFMVYVYELACLKDQVHKNGSWSMVLNLSA